MPKKKDENETAFDTLQEIINRDRRRDGLPVHPPKEEEKDTSKVESGRKGGRAGGPARAKKLNKEQKSEIARKAAKVRWTKKNDRS